jgi:acyl-CoA thioesterase FadM
MSLLLRLSKVLVQSSLGKPMTFGDASIVHLRVWPSDLDFNGHMNNGRYLSLMDLGRIDFSLRMGLGRTMLRERWQGLIGAATIRYRRSLKPFQSYALHTRLLGWDSKWFMMEQTFMREDQAFAQAYVQALFRGSRGNVDPQSIVDSLGGPTHSPALPPPVVHWMKSLKPQRLAQQA